MTQRSLTLSWLACVLAALTCLASATAADKPNIVIIWGDDIGRSNISAHTHGVVGYKTPNIDRVAREGMLFTDYYAEQSERCKTSRLLVRGRLISFLS